MSRSLRNFLGGLLGGTIGLFVGLTWSAIPMIVSCLGCFVLGYWFDNIIPWSVRTTRIVGQRLPRILVRTIVIFRAVLLCIIGVVVSLLTALIVLIGSAIILTFARCCYVTVKMRGHWPGFCVTLIMTTTAWLFIHGRLLGAWLWPACLLCGILCGAASVLVAPALLRFFERINFPFWYYSRRWLHDARVPARNAQSFVMELAILLAGIRKDDPEPAA